MKASEDTRSRGDRKRNLFFGVVCSLQKHLMQIILTRNEGYLGFQHQMALNALDIQTSTSPADVCLSAQTSWAKAPSNLI